MRDLSKSYNSRTFDYDKLIKYGFENNSGKYIYKTKIYKDQFEMFVQISKESKISKLIDLANEDEYILVDVEESSGEFVR